MTKADLPIILVVEDELYLNKAICGALEDEDFEVHSVTTGEDGLQKLETTKIDVCTVDMRLPGITGNEFISEAHKNHPCLQFIIYTGSVSYSIPKDLRKIGITKEQVFTKPIKNLNDLIEAVIKLHHQGDRKDQNEKDFDY